MAVLWLTPRPLPAHRWDFGCRPGPPPMSPAPSQLAAQLVVRVSISPPGWLYKPRLIISSDCCFPRRGLPRLKTQNPCKDATEEKTEWSVDHKGGDPGRPAPCPPLCLHFLLDTALQQEGLPARASGPAAPSARPPWAWMSAGADAISLAAGEISIKH